MQVNMLFLHYFFASVLSFLGLLAGIIIIKIAPEEQKPLKEYLVWTKRLLLLLIFIFTIAYYYNSIPHLLVLAILLIFLLIFEFKVVSLEISSLSFAALGFIFFLSSINISLFAIESSLIFLYGIAAASLLYDRKGRSHSKMLLYNFVFVIAATLLYIGGYHFSFLIFK